MVPEFGVIEGCFGRTWSHEDRKRVLSRLRELGFSWFHHAPKADAHLRRRLREPHPAVALAELADLAAHCRGLGMRCRLGLRPDEPYRDFGDSGIKDFVAKIRTLDEIGIDDLAILGRRLDPRVGVYWTGEESCAREFSPGHLARVAEALRRNPTLRDNYPVNDGPRMSRFLRLHAFTGRTDSIAPQIAAHAINPALRPHQSLIPAATLVACYREGTGYRHLRAFRAAARALAGSELADMLEHDLHALQDRALDQLGDDRARLRQRYAAVDHPMAAEGVRWLDGADSVDRWVEDA